jgi:hypothetical protein
VTPAEGAAWLEAGKHALAALLPGALGAAGELEDAELRLLAMRWNRFDPAVYARLLLPPGRRGRLRLVLCRPAEARAGLPRGRAVRGGAREAMSRCARHPVEAVVGGTPPIPPDFPVPRR